jgi:hypothetical protein
VLYRPIPVEPETLVPTMNRYFDNKKQIEAVCAAYAVRAVFVWQPTPAFKYDLQYHITLNRHYGLGGHERSGVGYKLMAERRDSRAAGDNFIWLADIQTNEKQPLYIDNMHYTSGFNRVIARHIADALVERNLISVKTSAEMRNLNVAPGAA